MQQMVCLRHRCLRCPILTLSTGSRWWPCLSCEWGHHAVFSHQCQAISLSRAGVCRQCGEAAAPVLLQTPGLPSLLCRTKQAICCTCVLVLPPGLPPSFLMQDRAGNAARQLHLLDAEDPDSLFLVQLPSVLPILAPASSTKGPTSKAGAGRGAGGQAGGQVGGSGTQAQGAPTASSQEPSEAANGSSTAGAQGSGQVPGVGGHSGEGLLLCV